MAGPVAPLPTEDGQDRAIDRGKQRLQYVHASSGRDEST
jgi:hypothetical protein